MFGVFVLCCFFSCQSKIIFFVYYETSSNIMKKFKLHWNFFKEFNFIHFINSFKIFSFFVHQEYSF